MTFQPSALLADYHDVTVFACGTASLDEWLKRRALANQGSGASRTYVVCDGAAVMGYFALAAGGISLPAAIGKFRRNMPDPIPVVILGRLAIDNRHQKRGLGRALFRDAARRAAQAAEVIGIRGILVHAISEGAKSFYSTIGFDPSPLDPMTLMVSLTDLRELIAN